MAFLVEGRTPPSWWCDARAAVNCATVGADGRWVDFGEGPGAHLAEPIAPAAGPSNIRAPAAQFTVPLAQPAGAQRDPPAGVQHAPPAGPQRAPRARGPPSGAGAAAGNVPAGAAAGPDAAAENRAKKVLKACDHAAASEANIRWAKPYLASNPDWAWPVS